MKSLIIVLLVGCLLGLIGSRPAQDKAVAETATTEKRLTYGLVVDNSRSLDDEFKQVVNAVGLIIDSKKEDDECFIIRFVASYSIQTMQDFTRDKAVLFRAALEMYTEAGESAVIDGVYLSVDHLLKNREKQNAGSRQALVVITDGDDRGSFYKLDQLLQLIRGKNIRIFVLGLPENVKKSRGNKAYKKAVSLMNKIAQETGGEAFIAEQTSELEARTLEVIKRLNGN